MRRAGPLSRAGSVCRDLGTSVVMYARMAQMVASDWSSDVMTGSGLGYR